MTNPPITLFTGATSEWQEMRRRMRNVQAKCPDRLTAKQTLGTRYCAEFEESSAPVVIEYADEMDELPEIAKEHRRDSWVAIGLSVLFLIGLIGGLASYLLR